MASVPECGVVAGVVIDVGDEYVEGDSLDQRAPRKSSNPSIVSADTIMRRVPSPGRSKRRTSSTSRPPAVTTRTSGTSMPTRAARRIPAASALTTGYRSVDRENFATVLVDDDRLRPCAANCRAVLQRFGKFR